MLKTCSYLAINRGEFYSCATLEYKLRSWVIYYKNNNGEPKQRETAQQKSNREIQINIMQIE